MIQKDKPIDKSTSQLLSILLLNGGCRNTEVWNVECIGKKNAIRATIVRY